MPTIPNAKWAFTARHQRVLERKECLADRSGDPCAGKIVRAHIIPRSQLRQIARDGRVYAVPTKLTAVMQMQHRSFNPKELGVGEFATLNCFCAKHDKTLFAPLEDIPLTFSPKQLALLHYRALSAEYYQRRNQQESAATELLLNDEDGPRADRFRWLFNINWKASEEAYEPLSRVEAALKTCEYHEVRGLFIRFKTKPNIMSVGAFRPHYNVLGKRVQDLGLPCHYIAMHILAVEKKAALVFTWLQGDSAAEAFAKCFSTQSKEQLTSLAIQTAFEHVEHTCMTGEWWLGLKRAQQNLLLERVRRANSLSYRRSYRCLMYRESYDDWGVEGLDLVHC
jgi:hypothetical protein